MRKSLIIGFVGLAIAGSFLIGRATQGALVTASAVAAERPPGKLVWQKNGFEAKHYPMSQRGDWYLQCDKVEVLLLDQELGAVADKVMEYGCKSWEVMSR